MARDRFVVSYLAASSVQELTELLQRELERLSGSLQEVEAHAVRRAYSAPYRAQVGDILYTDGVTWNPGAGEGVYYFNAAGTWTKL
jgi:hypothetical protein